MLSSVIRAGGVLIAAAVASVALAVPASAAPVDTRSPLPSTARAQIVSFGTVPSPQKNHGREGRYVVTVATGADTSLFNPSAVVTIKWCPTSIGTRCPGGWLKLRVNDETVKYTNLGRTLTLTGEFPKHFGSAAYQIEVDAKVNQRVAGRTPLVHRAKLGPLKTVLRGNDVSITPAELRG